MKTVLTAAATAAACAMVRHQVEKPGVGEKRWGRVCLRPMWNQRGAFGLPVAGRALAVPSLLALGLVWCCRHNAPVSAGLVLGGGGSNLLERLRREWCVIICGCRRAPVSWDDMSTIWRIWRFYRRIGAGAFQPPGWIRKNSEVPWTSEFLSAKGQISSPGARRRMSPVMADPAVMDSA